MLQYFLSLHRLKEKISKIAAREVTDKVLQFWANILVRHKPDCVNQVNKAFDKCSLKKNSPGKTNSIAERNEFTDTFENL